ncbi:hypothetical protein [Pseudomonas sp. zfem003]|uniref:hypothetical protein n=1 Tax=Pseudomonas sp. zfem003 TaxID=3078198 RepID=UPI0029288788|nr:hypothetical protein [Pseudomonas sp. zfem003]MDU9399057.1 hypothetical protein [Pseudomonas sp. zfem003]
MESKKALPILVRPGQEVKAWVERKAKEQDRSMNWIVSKILEREMRDEMQKQQA